MSCCDLPGSFVQLLDRATRPFVHPKPAITVALGCVVHAHRDILVHLQVRQNDLEDADGVPGKYTVGLGQVEMSVPSEHEDVVSMALSACSQLLEKHNVDPRSIGRLEVGTESAVDRSKSIKTYLMQVGTSHTPRKLVSLAGVACNRMPLL
jgi:hypothetical protein